MCGSGGGLKPHHVACCRNYYVFTSDFHCPGAIVLLGYSLAASFSLPRVLHSGADGAEKMSFLPSWIPLFIQFVSSASGSPDEHGEV